MAFVLPEGLAPEAYPMAWLVGNWRGEGVLSYPDIPESVVVQNVTFDHDGGPYLRYESTIRTRSGEAPANIPEAELPIWSVETGYWRVAPERPEGFPIDRTPLEVLLADPAGNVSVYLGAAGNGRIDLVSDLIARTSTAVEISGARRMYGLVGERLMWVWEIAAFGNPLKPYVSVELDRIEE